jgi:hypothetical protein
LLPILEHSFDRRAACDAHPHGPVRAVIHQAKPGDQTDSLQILSLEINHACEVPSDHAVKHLLSFMQIFSLMGCFCQPGSSGMRVVDAQDFCSAAGSA